MYTIICKTHKRIYEYIYGYFIADIFTKLLNIALYSSKIR